MKRFSALCSQWHGQVKHVFTMLHGHQTKVLALFVLGAIKAESIVVQRVAEELLSESDAKAPSIERRLHRFLSNERIVVEEISLPDTFKMRGKAKRKQGEKGRERTPKAGPEEQPKRKGTRPFKQE